MTRRQLPAERKQTDYAKQRVYVSPYGRRGPNPALQRKKARGNRAVRHTVHQNLVNPLRLVDLDPLEDIDDAPVRRRPFYRFGPMSLGAWLPYQHANAVTRLGRHRFFSRPYRTACHRAPFTALLTSVVAGQSGGAKDIAEFFARWLAPELWSGRLSAGRYVGGDAYRSAWLEAFFADEPAWRERLRAWIITSLAGPA